MLFIFENFTTPGSCSARCQDEVRVPLGRRTGTLAATTTQPNAVHPWLYYGICLLSIPCSLKKGHTPRCRATPAVTHLATALIPCLSTRSAKRTPVPACMFPAPWLPPPGACLCAYQNDLFSACMPSCPALHTPSPCTPPPLPACCAPVMRCGHAASSCTLCSLGRSPHYNNNKAVE